MSILLIRELDSGSREYCFFLGNMTMIWRSGSCSQAGLDSEYQLEF
jgi:hypothetical protein